MKQITHLFNEIVKYFTCKIDKKTLEHEETISVIQEKINLFTLEFIIKGEFNKIVNLNLIKQKQQKFANEILEKISELDKSEASAANFLIKTSEQFCTVLLEFLNIIQAQLETSSHILHQRHSFIESEEDEHNIFNELCEYLNLFILDISIKDDIDFFEKINELFNRYEKAHAIKPFKYLIIYEHKINFLKYKWLKRQKYNRIFLQENIRENYSEKIILNDEVINLSDKILIGEPYYTSYKDWLNKIEYHYFNKNDDDYGFVNSSLTKKDNLNTYDLYLRIKYYKDIDTDIDKLKEVKELFKELGVNKLNAKITSKNTLYYYNNYFSLLCEESIDFDKITKEYYRIRSIFNNQDNHNYFIHYKYLNFFTNHFSENIKSLEDNFDFRELYNIMKLCKNNFEWSIRGFNRIYDFTLEESFVEISKEKVYHASNFTLPLSIIENEYNIKTVENELHNIENSYQKHRLRSETEDITNKVDSLNKKSIETITIFTAIISFIIGTVGMYKFIDSFLQALIFILVFGLSISIFVLLIFINSKGLDKIKENKFKIISPYVAILLIIIGLFSLMQTNALNFTNNQKYIYLKQLDSLNSAYEEDIIRLQKQHNTLLENHKEEYDKLYLKYLLTTNNDSIN